MGYIGDLAVVIVMAVMAVGWIYVIMTWMAEGEISGKMGFAMEIILQPLIESMVTNGKAAYC